MATRRGFLKALAGGLGLAALPAGKEAPAFEGPVVKICAANIGTVTAGSIASRNGNIRLSFSEGRLTAYDRPPH